MFDKLELRTDNYKTNAISNLSKRYNHFLVGDKNYRECHIFRNELNAQIITLKLNPVFPNASFCSFEFNPRKLGSFKDTNELIANISDKNLIIKRIDYAIDVNNPIDEIRKSLKAKNKRARYDYTEKDSITGFELGNDQEVICVYDKAYELLKKRKYRLIKDAIPRVMTRIEIRHRAKKVPFKNYDEILNYCTINPFKALEFYKLTDMKEATEYELYRASKLLHTIQESGCLHGAIKRLNQNNNFKRDNPFLIRDIELEQSLERQFKSNLDAYFGGNND
jgi:hypothetical protein